MTKGEARLYAISKRKELNIIGASINIIDALIKSNVLDKFNKIGIYYPKYGEINALSLVDTYKDKTFYLPSTVQDSLEFKEYKAPLVMGAFNIMEATGPSVSRDTIDCFIIPCVGANRDNYRLGYGRGYYDRYLAGYRGLKIGLIAKELSELDFKEESHDLRLDIIYKG